MIQVVKANVHHVQGIAYVCSVATRATYNDIYTPEYIERVIKKFYNPARILREVTYSEKDWGGYFAAVENNEVIGACGGGMISDTAGEVYVLYLDPRRRNEGIGTKLLEAVSHQQKYEFHAKEQWVSVQEGNTKGIPFYEARGFVYQHKEAGYGKGEAENYSSLRYHRYL